MKKIVRRHVFESTIVPFMLKKAHPIDEETKRAEILSTFPAAHQSTRSACADDELIARLSNNHIRATIEMNLRPVRAEHGQSTRVSRHVS